MKKELNASEWRLSRYVRPNLKKTSLRLDALTLSYFNHLSVFFGIPLSRLIGRYLLGALIYEWRPTRPLPKPKARRPGARATSFPTTCSQCGATAFERGVFPTTLKVAGITFAARADLLRCTRCGTQALHALAMADLFNEIARHLARSGNASAAAFRFMRSQAGFSSRSLAALLDLPAETVTQMEAGKVPIDRRTVALVAILVEERLQEPAYASEKLRTLGSVKRLSRRVRLGRVGARW